MKKIIALLTFTFATIINSHAQLKMHTGGDATLGTTNPPPGGFKFQVVGRSVFTDSSGTINSAAFIRGMNDFSTETTPDYTWFYNDETGIFHPEDNTIAFSTASRERMRINSNGNLLVGTTFPGQARVVIDGQSDLAALMTFTDFSTDYAYAHVSYVNRKLTKNWVVVHDTTEKFCVYGDGTAWSNGSVLTSDSILKENVHTLQDSRSKILALRGVSFNFIPEHLNNPQDTFTVISTDPPRTEIGLIAEEVERVVPEVVLTNNHGIKGIAYSNIIALLIEGFKQQNATIDSLRMQLTLCCAGGHQGSPGQRTSNPNGTTNPTPDSQSPRLDQNTPNPFNSKTEIHFFIPEKSSSSTLMLFDMQGTLLKQYPVTSKGESSIIIFANELKPGMYLYSLVVDQKETDTKRMILTQ